MRPPASAFENRIQGAEKIGPSRYSDFFNKISPYRPLLRRNRISGVAGIATAAGPHLKRRN